MEFNEFHRTELEQEKAKRELEIKLGYLNEQNFCQISDKTNVNFAIRFE